MKWDAVTRRLLRGLGVPVEFHRYRSGEVLEVLAIRGESVEETGDPAYVAEPRRTYALARDQVGTPARGDEITDSGQVWEVDGFVPEDSDSHVITVTVRERPRKWKAPGAGENGEEANG